MSAEQISPNGQGVRRPSQPPIGRADGVQTFSKQTRPSRHGPRFGPQESTASTHSPRCGSHSRPLLHIKPVAPQPLVGLTMQLPRTQAKPPPQGAPVLPHGWDGSETGKQCCPAHSWPEGQALSRSPHTTPGSSIWRHELPAQKDPGGHGEAPAGPQGCRGSPMATQLPSEQIDPWGHGCLVSPQSSSGPPWITHWPAELQ